MKKKVSCCFKLLGGMMALSSCTENPSLGEDLVLEGSKIVMDPIELCTGTQVRLESIHQITPLGSSAGDILSLLEPMYRSTFRWSESDDPVVLHDFEDKMVQLELEIFLDPLQMSENLVYIDSDTCGPNTSCVQYCDSRIELDARLRIHLSDRSFSEDWPIRLGLLRLRRNQGYQFRIYHAIEWEHVRGSFSMDSYGIDPQKSGWNFYYPPIFQAEIDSREAAQRPSFRGRILLTLTDPGGGFWYHPIGNWPQPSLGH